MTELLLDERHRYALDRQLGSAGVAQPMGMHALLNPRPARQSRQERPDIARLQGMSVEDAEDSGRPAQAQPAAFVEPPGDQAESGRVHPDGPVAVPLAMANRQGARGGIQVAPFQSQGLGDPEASAAEDGEQGTVANAGGSAG